jgi:hypothetical protein
MRKNLSNELKRNENELNSRSLIHGGIFTDLFQAVEILILLGKVFEMMMTDVRV